MTGKTGTGFKVSSSVTEKEIFRKVLASGMGYWEADQYVKRH